MRGGEDEEDGEERGREGERVKSRRAEGDETNMIDDRRVTASDRGQSVTPLQCLVSHHLFSHQGNMQAGD